MEWRPTAPKITLYGGSGMAIGGALGLLFGLMLLEDGVTGLVVGAVVGAVMGMIWELQGRDHTN